MCFFFIEAIPLINLHKFRDSHKKDNLVLSSGLIMWISHRKRDSKTDVSSVRRDFSNVEGSSSDEGLTLETSAFESLLRWLIHIINPVDKTILSRYASHRRSTTVSLETHPSSHMKVPFSLTMISYSTMKPPLCSLLILVIPMSDQGS